VIVYGVLLYGFSALLFPDDLRDYDGFKEYFYLRRGWFFGTMALISIVGNEPVVVIDITGMEEYSKPA
jgi:hypothetical protein